MSTAAPSAGLGLDSGGLWHRRALQRSRTLARTYLMSYSAPPLPITNASRLRNTLQLPSLAAGNPPLHQTPSVALRPAEKLMVKPHRQSQFRSTEQRELRPSVMQYRRAPHEGTLAVRGKHCLPSPPAPSVAQLPTPARTQLHVFLPTEGAGEGEEGDNESVDEGFMDELDKVTSLKLHQGEPKNSIRPDNASYC
ncbi:hypothetical protein AAFF_G00196190 [Aldrovandia affinis]|uniref:Uncharacterized protein n=1 Tax=Aldrovandia affinis TaxID=143900 RepID=A0AAD7RIH2_9TELE|nr:hypothetical protein AAFF_G00196190 [Aldrovandia affinis]